MGEKLYVVTNVDLPSFSFDVELNEGSAASKKPLHIHLQNRRFRLDLTDREYMQMAIAVRAAANKIREYKELENDDE